MKIDNYKTSHITKKYKTATKSNSKFQLFEDEDSHIEQSIPSLHNISALNHLLSLQDINYNPNNKDDERTLLMNASNILLAKLEQIMFNLINNNLNKNIIFDLKDTIEKQNLSFNNKDIQDLYNNVYLRICVECEKLKCNY